MHRRPNDKEEFKIEAVRDPGSEAAGAGRPGDQAQAPVIGIGRRDRGARHAKKVRRVGCQNHPGEGSIDPGSRAAAARTIARFGQLVTKGPDPRVGNFPSADRENRVCYRYRYAMGTVRPRSLRRNGQSLFTHSRPRRCRSAVGAYANKKGAEAPVRSTIRWDAQVFGRVTPCCP